MRKITLLILVGILVIFSIFIFLMVDDNTVIVSVEKDLFEHGNWTISMCGNSYDMPERIWSRKIECEGTLSIQSMSLHSEHVYITSGSDIYYVGVYSSGNEIKNEVFRK
ncbi:hypothetical protein SAMN06297229_0038 [Pseudidiomarina planktonica]|uniref:Uncharacterized protein n=1 Tax=Pseudidiomarina planktonica TaxID=1323738 RepID=A0A1Y6E5E6_9GAMM|nr:hypothetical protein CWI77_08535 [Pseudidiomarina planktonica]SMQ57975.1 hypothetical protein SAMN06297229_0038 [Pseudidiomarina planktonica]